MDDGESLSKLRLIIELSEGLKIVDLVFLAERFRDIIEHKSTEDTPLKCVFYPCTGPGSTGPIDRLPSDYWKT